MFYEDDDFFNQILRSHEEGDGKKGVPIQLKQCGGSGSGRIRNCWPDQDPGKSFPVRIRAAVDLK
jgi:hypothetical protein